MLEPVLVRLRVIVLQDLEGKKYMGKNASIPLIATGILPTSRGPLDAVTVARAPKENRNQVAMQLAFNPKTAIDRQSTLAKWYGSRTPGMVN